MDNRKTELQMAPFQGITTTVFRKIYTKHFSGIDKLFTPFFTSIQKQELNKARAAELSEVRVNGIPLVPQILSNDAEEILRFADYVKRLGFDEVNWNLGCPFPRVANKKRGSGLLPYLEMVRKILDEVMPEIPVRFSVKARLGYDDPGDIFRLITVFNDYPLSELTIHARLGKQLYKGEADLEMFGKVVGLTKIPLGYNGDIFTLEDFKMFVERFPDVRLIMLGRGLLVDPFLPAWLKGSPVPAPEDQKEKVEKFVTDLYLAYRKKFNESLTSLNVMKEYWWYLAHSFENPHKVFRLVKKTRTFDEFETAVKMVFEGFSWWGQQADLFRRSRISK